MFVLRIPESEPCPYCSCLWSHLNIYRSLEADIFSCEVAAWLTRGRPSLLLWAAGWKSINQLKFPAISTRQTWLLFENEGGFLGEGFVQTPHLNHFWFLFQVLVTQLQNIYWNEKQLDADSSAICDTEQFKREKKNSAKFLFSVDTGWGGFFSQVFFFLSQMSIKNKSKCLTIFYNGSYGVKCHSFAWTPSWHRVISRGCFSSLLS